MPEDFSSPIFCDECSAFAMAELEGVYLCTSCLLRAVIREGTGAALAKIKPLETTFIAKPHGSKTPTAESSL